MKQVSIPTQDEGNVSGRFRFFFREALRRLWVSRRNSFAAISMITIALFVLGSFLLVSENLERAVDRWQGKSRVTIYLQPDTTDEGVRIIESHLAASTRLEKRRFVSREEALEKFRGFFSDLSVVVDDLGENPFPPSFEIEVDPADIQSRELSAEIDTIRNLPGVDDVQLDWQWVHRMRKLVDAIDLMGLIAGGILGLAAAFTIANVTRLTMVLYREEIDIMRLVGANEGIIRIPFLIEGVLQGIAGSILAIVFLIAGFYGARQAVGPSNALIIQFLFVTFLPWPKLLAIIGCGILSGLAGSLLSMREQKESWH